MRLRDASPLLKRVIRADYPAPGPWRVWGATNTRKSLTIIDRDMPVLVDQASLLVIATRAICPASSMPPVAGRVLCVRR
ncbi:hypothetical protein [Actinocrispum wychmicini]|uniref:Uncharacterized protein n=1 Tax=Actinocrispum wychmicini TaxID=1213861 RepID=A0A4R2JZX0_9PSEU|nr:hypothetical protein [Actinocrispum wychmicini]TCO62996.1 hypothetical protein EV192_1021140 [Actinocrispum wychmicini]